jgi:hypothetical protein
MGEHILIGSAMYNISGLPVVAAQYIVKVLKPFGVIHHLHAVFFKEQTVEADKNESSRFGYLERMTVIRRQQEDIILLIWDHAVIDTLSAAPFLKPLIFR